jgi:hypothetical protein
MARFAQDCLHATHRLTTELALALTLGPDTVDLDMRIGLHSGPVTADCRCVAWREVSLPTFRGYHEHSLSNGFKCRRRQLTYLSAQGRQGKLVLKPREDKIVAKGKGELQTYWLLTENTGTTTVGGDIDLDGSQDSRNEDDPDTMESAVISAMKNRKE